MKIAIIGYSGSGKSTLSQKLSQYHSIPLLHLDTLQFTEGWQVRPPEDFRADLSHFLKQNTSWIIDGNYSQQLFKERMKQADTIIFMDFPRWKSLLRAWSRYRTYKGRSRESMATGCPEKFDWEFIRWILWDGRSKCYRHHFRSVCLQYPNKVAVLSSQKDIDALLEKCKR